VSGTRAPSGRPTTKLAWLGAARPPRPTRTHSGGYGLLFPGPAALPSGSRFSASALAMSSSVAAFAESISARRSASVFCRGSAQSLRSASSTAPCSTNWLVESTMKWCVESEEVDRICAPNVLLRLFLELNEGAHASAVWHCWFCWRSPELIRPDTYSDRFALLCRRAGVPVVPDALPSASA
jgi:hypothetical protein